MVLPFKLTYYNIFLLLLFSLNKIYLLATKSYYMNIYLVSEQSERDTIMCNEWKLEIYVCIYICVVRTTSL